MGLVAHVVVVLRRVSFSHGICVGPTNMLPVEERACFWRKIILQLHFLLN